VTIIVITRPALDAATLIDAVMGKGFQPLLEPMLSIEPLSGPDLDTAGAQALLFTSANGVRAFAARTKDRSLPVFAVGDATANAAENEGFARVSSAAGSAEELATLIIGRCSPNSGRLIHASGKDIAADLGGLLRPFGFSVDRIVVYVARAATGLSHACQGALSDGTVRAVLFFSPRSAATFARLVDDAKLRSFCREVAALCFSSAVANNIQGVQWRTLAVSLRPTQEAMIDLLDQECADNDV
jgi:uroporphyrinogen-III synthase